MRMDVLKFANQKVLYLTEQITSTFMSEDEE